MKRGFVVFFHGNENGKFEFQEVFGEDIYVCGGEDTCRSSENYDVW